MTTRVIPAMDAGQIASAAAEAAEELQRGGVAGLPTETVYGLGCDALQPDAAARVFAVKERPSFDPLIVHVADASWIGRCSSATGGVLQLAERLAAAFWPGPFTMVLPADGLVPDLVRSGLSTVALRCSAHPVLSAVVAALERPVAAPSANRFGRISPVAAADVVEELGGRIPLVLDGGPCRHGLESTIVAVEDGRVVLLRPGPVTAEQLHEHAAVETGPRARGISAPGMLESHYAPRTPLRLWTGQEAPEDAGTSALLSFGDTPDPRFARQETLPASPEAAAPQFFSALRRLDAAGVERIYARPVPEDGLGRAIMDRLRRAAHE